MSVGDDVSTGLRVKAQFTSFEWNQLKMQGLVQERAQALAGQKIPLAPYMTKEHLISLLRDREPVDEGSSFSDAKYNLTEYYVEPYPPSNKPLKELRNITLSDLRIETRHLGSRIFVKTVCAAKRIACVSVIVEDEKGVPGQLQIFNLGRKVDLEEFLPVGQILCVKEPFFKFSTTAIQSLRVDHFEDLVLLDDCDEEVPNVWKVIVDKSAEGCKEFGNQAFQGGKVAEAIKWYTKGLDILTSGRENPAVDEDAEKLGQENGAKTVRVALLLNRALAYLYRGEDERAVQDCEAVHLYMGPNRKALYRQAEALYNLRRFEDCARILARLLSLCPDDKDGKSKFQIVRQRLLEQIRGQYDFANMVELAKNDYVGQEFNFADYTAPVYAKTSDISGNGLFTRKDVKMGDLLFVCKAFMNCRGSDNGVSVMIRPAELHVDQGVGAFLSSAVLEKLRKNPSAYDAILKLHNAYGKRWRTGQEDNKAVDAFLVRNICNSNAFGSCSYYDDFPEMRAQDGIPAARNPKKTMEEPFDPNSGLWILPSYMNHSCIPNARRTFLGNMMILRAVVDMPKDTEILVTYTDCNLPYKDRKKIIETSWKFTCNCKLCQFQSAPGVSEALENVMKKIHPIIVRTSEGTPKISDVEQLRRLIIELEKLYIFEAHIVPRPYLGEHILRLYGLLNHMGEMRPAFDTLHAGPPAWGAVFKIEPETGVDFEHKGWADADLVRAYVRLATLAGILGGKVFEDWKAVAKDCYRVVAGEDVTFEGTFGAVIRQFTELENGSDGKVDRPSKPG
ncbi:hypothetical protein TWF481_011552 [Arthrobotrys musiformis]|uniref:SET domain-containing protein n=1 Tax=Arthrobotrys musiformis TaxID=47236 RepID=A0AAV9W1M0_9PEZI